jgi:hypothetical protein
MDAEHIVRFWRAAEMFSPRPLPRPDIRENIIDVDPGDPLPWEPGGRLAGRELPPGKVWRHVVFGGLFTLADVRGALGDTWDDNAQSALFTCAISQDGTLIGDPAVSECAWAVGQVHRGHEAVGDRDPATWLTGSSPAGRLPVARENLPDLPDGPLTSAATARFTADLAELLGVTILLRPRGLRVHSRQIWVDETPDQPSLAGYFATDLALVEEAIRESAAGPGPGPALAAFLRAPDDSDHVGRVNRVDISAQPLIVRDGCAPDRIPPARWPADTPLTLSEQFTVNEISEPAAALSAIHAPRGSGEDDDNDCADVFSDLIAAIVTERARRLADLPSPGAAFGATVRWLGHTIAVPAPALTGFEIVLAAPDHGLRTADVGANWRDRVTETDYFDSTARLAGGAGPLIMAELGDQTACRAFVERCWHGIVHGAEALFPAGESLRATLEAPTAAGWPASVARFRAALAKATSLSAERSLVSAALTSLSALEQACEDAYSSLETAQATVASLTGREPLAREELVAAEERRRAALADLETHQRDKPGMVVAMSTGLRAGRDWYEAHGALRAAYDAAARDRDTALAAVQSLRAGLAGARATMATARAEATRLAGAMESLYAPVAEARRRWGERVPEGPSYAETEDAALIERRENSVAWGDEEFAAARAELFLAALSLHKSFVFSNAEAFAANLAAWTEMVSAADEAQRPPPAAAMAAWQSFFLVMPAVSASFASLGSLLADLGRGSIGWLLAAGSGRVPPRYVAGALWRANRAVLAGEPVPGEASAHSLASQTARLGTWLPDGSWTGLPVRPRREHDQPAAGAAAAVGSETETLRTVLSDLRERARSRRPPQTA